MPSRLRPSSNECAWFPPLFLVRQDSPAQSRREQVVPSYQSPQQMQMDASGNHRDGADGQKRDRQTLREAQREAEPKPALKHRGRYEATASGSDADHQGDQERDVHSIESPAAKPAVAVATTSELTSGRPSETRPPGRRLTDSRPIGAATAD